MAKNITGTLKYLESGQLVTDWGEGNFIALKFTNNDPEKIKTIKVGLDPSQGSGLVPLDEDMNGVFKITDKDTQKFVVESYDENNEKLSRDEYNLTGLICEEKPVPHYVFSSEVLEDGGSYESNYFIAAKSYTITGMTGEETVTLTQGTRAVILTNNGDYDAETGIYSGSISGVNQDHQDYNYVLKVDDTVVCAFTIKGKPAIEIGEMAKNIEIENDMEAAMDVDVLNTEATVTSFDISAEGLTTKTNVPFEVIPIEIPGEEEATGSIYSVTVSSDLFDVSENGTYEATLTANMSDSTTLTDTFALTVNLTDQGPDNPVDPEEH